MKVGTGLSNQIRGIKAKALMDKYGKYETQKGVQFFGFGFPEIYLASSIEVDIIPSSMEANYSPNEILGRTAGNLIVEGTEVNLGTKILSLLASKAGETHGGFMKGLAYQTAVAYNKEETELRDIILDQMLEEIEESIEEKAPPTNFRLNASTFFADELKDPKSSYIVQNIPIRYIEGDLESAIDEVSKRISDLKGGVKDINRVLKYAQKTKDLGELKRFKNEEAPTTETKEDKAKRQARNEEKKKQFKKFKERVMKDKQDMLEVLNLSAALIEGIAKQPLNKEKRELERYWGSYQPFDKFRVKFDHLAFAKKAFVEQYWLDVERLTSDEKGPGTKKSRTLSTDRLSKLKVSLEKAMEIETYKRDYIKYLIQDKVLTDKEEYFKNLA